MAETVPDASVTKGGVPMALRIVGHVLRAVFLLALIVVAIRVSAPQSETVWSAYETPGDLVRLVLGAAVAIGILVQLFRPPKDAQAYRTWAYLGIFLAPLAVVVALVDW
jgi:TRAP-type C4-dicarboxylate transport system permease small subunit